MNLIDPGLLEILCCPETHQPVTEADDALVAGLNQRISAGTLKTGAGRTIDEKLDGALVRKDRRVAYPIRNRIPIMLIEEAIALEPGPAAGG